MVGLPPLELSDRKKAINHWPVCRCTFVGHEAQMLDTRKYLLGVRCTETDKPPRQEFAFSNSGREASKTLRRDKDGEAGAGDTRSGNFADMNGLVAATQMQIIFASSLFLRSE